MEMITIILLSISLSMDAFSLALAYGTLNMEKRLCQRISLMVGIFHFVMPLLGMSVKRLLVNYSSIPFHFITFLIYIYLGIMLLLEVREERKVTPLASFKEQMLFCFAVSIDSFTVGIALFHFTLIAPISFAIFSASFTLLGLKLGSKIRDLLGKIAVVMGAFFFFLLAFLHL